MVNRSAETKGGTNTFYAKSRKQWRKWLEKNHETEKAVWLIVYHKESQTQSIYYDEAVEEALCFGWIDSKPNKRDKESYYLYFSQRNPKSNWSKINRERAVKLIEQGVMTSRGQAMIDLAKKSGTWSALQNVENGIVPEDLQKLFNTNKIAYENFQRFSLSARRTILEWLLNARTANTRNKRLEQIVELAAQNIQANRYPKSKTP